MPSTRELHPVMRLDEAAEVERIAERIRERLRQDIKRRGLVVAVSGGIDSALSAALCARALGPGKIFGLLLPERDSSRSSTRRGTQLVEHLGIEHRVENIAPTLEAIGCYRWRDEAIRRTFPDYDADWKSKIAIVGGAQGQINRFLLVVESPDGEIQRKRLGHREYLQIVAATNFKQRIRKTIEYFHADRLHYAVVGTPNRVEYDQGFFVKNGDGAADLKPIAHLYKSQVYALARHLGLPEEICSALPTTDTYSMPQGQDEFYFALPFDKMDLALWAHNQKLPAVQLAEMIDLPLEQAEYVYHDIETKRSTTAMLHWPGLLVESVAGPLRRPD
jgi:NAD+ synthase